MEQKNRCEPWQSYYDSFLQYKLTYNFNPNTIIDIGAAFGEWSYVINNIYPDSKYLLIESDERFTPFLKKLNKPFEISHLYSSDNVELDVFKHVDNDKNSFGVETTLENSIFLLEQKILYKTKTKTTSLDTLLKKYNILPENIGLMKLDVQGVELDILKGCSFLEKHKPWIMMEVSFVQYNQGQPLLNEVVIYMDNLGYKTLEIPYLHYMFNENIRIPVQCDMIFVPKEFVDIYKRSEQYIVENKLADTLETK